MITVKNRLSAPLVVNVPDEPAVYFLAKETKDLTSSQYNAPDMQMYIRQGHIVVLRIS
jgi:hypothetical protein